MLPVSGEGWQGLVQEDCKWWPGDSRSRATKSKAAHRTNVAERPWASAVLVGSVRRALDPIWHLLYPRSERKAVDKIQFNQASQSPLVGASLQWEGWKALQPQLCTRLAEGHDSSERSQGIVIVDSDKWSSLWFKKNGWTHQLASSLSQKPGRHGTNPRLWLE